MSSLYLFALANLCICMAVAFISLCRLNAMDHALLRVRVEYAGYLTASLTFGLQPLYGRWPWWESLLISAALLIGLLASGRAWAGDTTPASASDHAPLGKD